MKKGKGSRIPGFYDMDFEAKLKELASRSELPENEIAVLRGDGSLTIANASHMIENVIGLYPLPLGIALNFVINDREVLIPMVIEEPSVVAGASYMAKLARSSGGFVAKASSPEMIGQLQLLDVADVDRARQKLLAEKKIILEQAGKVDPLLLKLGGGARDLEIRIIEDSPIGTYLVLHLIMDVRDAMGANAVNTAAERIAPLVEQITGGRVHLRILSNLADRRLAKVYCTIRLEELAFGEFSAEKVRDGIIEAWAFAASDPYRAATHNKGIMNGIDAVVIATGNDWRAVEAGAHAFAARSGKYQPLSTWSVADNGDLLGELEMPMAVGIVGGATRVHPGAKLALQIMAVNSANELAEIIVAVGLAQNLAALRALATEGIQRGHMNLHARQIAITAGAQGDDIEKVANQLVEEKQIRIDRAEEILREWKNKVN